MLLSIAMKLEAAGIDLDTAMAATQILQRHLGRAVKELVELFVRRVKDGAVSVADPEPLFSTLRPLGIEAVKTLFAREMERELRGFLESGGLRALPTKKKRKR
jgi:hypothetical protein